MKQTIVLTAVLLLIAGAAFAQPGDALDYSPVACFMADQPPTLQLAVTGRGELRGYFRHINSTEWCSVEGSNRGKLSTVVMPKFALGDEVEYFFVLLNGKQVVAKTPEIYRAKVTSGCETNYARHSTAFTLDCGMSAAGLPTAHAAGYALGTSAPPPDISPANPPQ